MTHREPASPGSGRRLITRESLSWPVIGLTCTLFMLIDVVIVPKAVRGDRWYLALIYGYPEPGVYFGVPLENFVGWFVVGLIGITGYRLLEGTATLPAFPHAIPVTDEWLGCGLYYLVQKLTQSGYDHSAPGRIAPGPGGTVCPTCPVDHPWAA